MARRGRKAPKNPWLSYGLDAWMLGVEASAVIGLRAAKMMVGGKAADAEALRMVHEKIEAAVALQMLAVTGGLGFTSHAAATKTLAHYRRKVRANRRRLTRV